MNDEFYALSAAAATLEASESLSVGSGRRVTSEAQEREESESTFEFSEYDGDSPGDNDDPSLDTIVVQRSWACPAPVLRSIATPHGFTSAQINESHKISKTEASVSIPEPKRKSPSPGMDLDDDTSALFSTGSYDPSESGRMGVLLNPQDTKGIQLVEMYDVDPKLLPPELAYHRPVQFTRVGDDTSVSKRVFKDVKSASQKLKDMRLPFVCSFCSRAFSRKAKATRHESTCRRDSGLRRTPPVTSAHATSAPSGTPYPPRSAKRMSLDARSMPMRGSHGSSSDEYQARVAVGPASWPGINAGWMGMQDVMMEDGEEGDEMDSGKKVWPA
ncbi:hypothetical protein M427DRAFT_68614 [Gonapodya prolifera JEL478]|uniref:C2H2-type domain-containing protein n=1 Tax=Gonapodya prolifera (strain JEL478) TaxID=1344416 RepID=A0A139ALB0_GONPJ|nr:hypothetical protein M427DRAFT_68614 [Gonapodya prolifera JEL478]|eukprot:KXS17205.1 hypothetical protein M427DRAFT_68614 [Gonapodya prolifera JEL478]